MKALSVTKENVKINSIYYTPSYSNYVKVRLLYLIDNGRKAFIESKNGTFVRELRWIFEDAKSAKYARRDWESAERRRRKK